MANSSINFAQNSYSGEVLNDLLTYTAQGNDTYQEGLIHIKSGIQYKYTIPTIKLGKIIQDNVATPTTQGAASDSTGMNQYTFNERYLEPQDFMVYLEFNPRDYETYWKFAQPNGPLVFRELDPKIQATMLRLLIEKKNEYIGESIWCSVKGGDASESKYVKPATGDTVLGGEADGGPMKYFDGAVARMLANIKGTDTAQAAGGKVILAGSTALSTASDAGAAVESALYSMWKVCPKTIRKKSGLVFVMGWELWDAYDQYLSGKYAKYRDNTEQNQYRFKGKRIIPIVGIPEETIVLTTLSTGMDSNLWMGIDYANDQEVVKVERLQANSELYFFQMRMKMDVNIVRPSEIVLWTAYTNHA